MSGQLAEVEARIGTVHKLSAVIAAMRGIAASRVQDANRHLDAIRMYASTIGDAIGHALTFPGSARATEAAGAETEELLVALCAEQGFAGAFSARVLGQVAELHSTAESPTEVLLVGDRGLLIAHEHQIRIDWTAPMIAHPGRIAHLAGRIIAEVFARISSGRAGRVSIVHAVPGGAEGYEIVVKSLIPFDYSRFPVPASGGRPLITLDPDVLLSQLMEEYVFAEISEALMMSFAAENEARMRSMIAAHDNVTASLNELVGKSRRLRQDAITEEIMELATQSLPRR